MVDKMTSQIASHWQPCDAPSPSFPLMVSLGPDMYRVTPKINTIFSYGILSSLKIAGVGENGSEKSFTFEDMVELRGEMFIFSLF